jgi:hypothetical protein
MSKNLGVKKFYRDPGSGGIKGATFKYNIVALLIFLEDLSTSTQDSMLIKCG